MPTGVYDRSKMKHRGKLKPYHIEFIRKNRFKMSGSDIARKFRLDKNIVTRYMRKNGLSVPKELQLKFRVAAMTGRTSSTPEIDRFLKKNYLSMPVKRMAYKINKSHCFVSTRMRQLNLVTPRHIIEKFKRDTWIKPGNIPVNKGKKMSIALYKKCAPTMFKKGNLPHNTKADGCISIRHDHPNRRGYRYKWIRIAIGKWEMLHVHNWKKAHGRIPKGYIVVFKDGNTMNCSLSNLEMITLAENMKRNTIHRYPMELKQTMRMIGKLDRKLKQHGKK